ncbi:fluoride efflux transporter CrcB [Gilvimarinus agarilyticus]|uniref:fluoride efflux transporter CrcB n=1 Tax=unclassified Gilvimarinus TaxID=2642066 RepID=UPI001C0948F3|nr:MULTISPECIES: fluoride efflux transporter CrcB [unclassified Gilvimarinus]MBU2886431.1 fluoride efflux transporter CrcB [Gilvimarinus agarilyticus]MDO6571110.1 fluoride efflux transporter CrcB [Gilvimarinus sp. 2_MG-2023]MDO6745654.1 fluoride efflux transporter CrcB [Gilvimarinus sp. 1_MG-2023]
MQWLFIGCGGALGAMLRFYITAQLFPVTGNKFPLGTLTVNLLGCALVAVCYVAIVEKGLLPPYWRHLAIGGFLGALTTFSTFSLDALLLWQNGLHMVAVLYVLANVLGCLLVVTGSWYLANFMLS